MARDHSTLPDWIPEQARQVYANTGIYKNERLEQAFSSLFAASKLKDVWAHFQKASLQASATFWPYLVGGLVLTAGNVPTGRATREKPDQKIITLDNQAEANKLVAQVARQAADLAATLRDLGDLVGASVPVELDSTLDLIGGHLASQAGASCLDEWKTFDNALSTQQVLNIPAPAELIDALAEIAALHDRWDAARVFEGNARLRSSSSSWCDFIRCVKDELFPDLDRQHGFVVELRELDWVNLVQAMINEEINRSSVSSCLRRIAKEISPG